MARHEIARRIKEWSAALARLRPYQHLTAPASVALGLVLFGILLVDPPGRIVHAAFPESAEPGRANPAPARALPPATATPPPAATAAPTDSPPTESAIRDHILSSRGGRSGLSPGQIDFLVLAVRASQVSQRETGVPAPVTIAQAILESSWGTSELARAAKNYFGIKATDAPGPAGVYWVNTREFVNGRFIVVRAPFRAYETPEQSFSDHGRFLAERPYYREAMAVRDDPRAFANALQKAGYATDPSYASKLLGLMERYDLYRFLKLAE
ncbi:MAG TPA: glucosaminidase domain-containing protein [Chloroflexota bacterium]